MAIDIKTGKVKLATKIGGYSGKGIKPIAVRAVHEVYKVVKDIPIIGMGGIYTAEDIIEFIMAGATAVQIGTAIFQEPNISEKIITDLETYCEK